MSRSGDGESGRFPAQFRRGAGSSGMASTPCQRFRGNAGVQAAWINPVESLARQIAPYRDPHGVRCRRGWAGWIPGLFLPVGRTVNVCKNRVLVLFRLATTRAIGRPWGGAPGAKAKRLPTITPLFPAAYRRPTRQQPTSAPFAIWPDAGLADAIRRPSAALACRRVYPPKQCIFPAINIQLI